MAEQFAIIRYSDEAEDYFSGIYVNTPHKASMLIDDGVYEDEPSLEAALQRTFHVCMHLNIPIQQHFRRIYIHDESGPIQDEWALSDLALYLLLINGDPHNEHVAFAQAYAIKRAFNK